MADDYLTGRYRSPPKLAGHDGELALGHISEERHVLQKLLRTNRKLLQLARSDLPQLRRQVFEHALCYSLGNQPGASFFFNGFTLCVQDHSLGQTLLRRTHELGKLLGALINPVPGLFPPITVRGPELGQDFGWC